ncbi:hypothetical protein D9619_010448 [Psilocybe cf. subviscida]|uniref:HTH psq-type domain-containing protein n=1 Tax=Psilocybe cf. subviscida TaxID=2480587 RepID=A0A8H5ATJ6_9AGAR|nr:hypothetical protein D9619_010448 [Psilocybe cf. subviscida]
MPHEVPDNLAKLGDKERIELAIHAVHNSGLTLKGQHKLGLRKAAEYYSIPRETFCRCFNGISKSQVEASIAQHALTPAEEEILIEWAKVMGWHGIALMHTTIAEYASEISTQPLPASLPNILTPIIIGASGSLSAGSSVSQVNADADQPDTFTFSGSGASANPLHPPGMQIILLHYAI